MHTTNSRCIESPIRDTNRCDDCRAAPCERRLRVLVVDDHHASADTLAMLMNAWGHDVRRAYDGAAGLALAADYLPDIMLLDIMMPRHERTPSWR